MPGSAESPVATVLHVFFLLSFKSLTNVIASVICLRKKMHYLFSPAPLYICGVMATSCLQSQHAGQLCCHWRKGVSYGCPFLGISTIAVLPELLPCLYSPGSPGIPTLAPGINSDSNKKEVLQWLEWKWNKAVGWIFKGVWIGLHLLRNWLSSWLSCCIQTLFWT